MDLTVDFKAQTTPDDIVTELLTCNEKWQLNQAGISICGKGGMYWERQHFYRLAVRH